MNTKKKSRRTVITINLNSVEEILDKCNEIIAYNPGVLLDNYILDIDNLTFGNSKKHWRYLIIKEKYLNCWQSISEGIFTNDEQEFERYYYEEF